MLMPDIFIIHCKEDRYIADEIDSVLRSAGYYAQCDEKYGLFRGLFRSDYIETISKAFDSAKAYIVIISPKSVKSRQVYRELVRAIENEKVVFALLLGLKYEEVQERRPKWRQALGATFSTNISNVNVFAIIHRMDAILRQKGIRPMRDNGPVCLALPDQQVWVEPWAKKAVKEKSRVESGGPEVPGGRVDLVHFSVTSPTVVQPSYSFVVGIYAHLKKQINEVIQMAQKTLPEGELRITTQGPLKVERGTRLTVRLKLEDFTIEPAEATILWEGEIGNATFGVNVPRDARRGRRVGIATIHTNGFQVATIFFELHVGKKSSGVKQIKARVKQHRTAFASYASYDRSEVMKRIQGMQKAAPELDIFVDVDSLRSGQEWWKEMKKIIPTRDVFYLFWSANASKSTWVEKEWRCALKKRGLHFIDPCPLVSPKEVPPPRELEKLHFEDRWRAYGERE